MTIQDSGSLRDRKALGSGSTSRFRASRKLMVTLLIGLSGGTMFSTCQSRLRDATVNASKDFVLSLFDPQTIITSLLGDPPTDDGG